MNELYRNSSQARGETEKFQNFQMGYRLKSHEQNQKLGSFTGVKISSNKERVGVSASSR